MAKIIKRLPSGTLLTEAEEFDPIYSEGWTIGPVTGPRTVGEGEEDLEKELLSFIRTG